MLHAGHGKTPQPEPKESSTVEGVPSRSNYGAEHTAAMPRVRLEALRQSIGWGV